MDAQGRVQPADTRLRRRRSRARRVERRKHRPCGSEFRRKLERALQASAGARKVAARAMDLGEVVQKRWIVRPHGDCVRLRALRVG